MQAALPTLISYLQALSTPAIAIAGAFIAWGQLRLAHNRFQYDLYERRLKIYKAVNDFLYKLEEEATQTTDAPLKALQAFNREAFEYVFLFEQDLNEYIDGIKSNAYARWQLNNKFARLNGQTNDRDEETFKNCTSEEGRLIGELSVFRNQLIEKFRKYLGPKLKKKLQFRPLFKRRKISH